MLQMLGDSWKTGKYAWLRISFSFSCANAVVLSHKVQSREGKPLEIVWTVFYCHFWVNIFSSSYGTKYERGPFLWWATSKMPRLVPGLEPLSAVLASQEFRSTFWRRGWSGVPGLPGQHCCASATTQKASRCWCALTWLCQYWHTFVPTDLGQFQGSTIDITNS